MADHQRRRSAGAETTGMTLLPVHIVAGLIAIVAGYISVFAVKGLKLHRKSGMVFVYSMLVLAATGAMIAAIKNQPANVIGGSLAFYLVSTAVLTVQKRSHGFHVIDAAATLVAIAVGGLSIYFGIEGLNSPSGTINGVPPGMIFFFATVALLGALGDVRVMWAGALQGAHRIARHLWRMCFALFIATGSFFLGQAQVFPKPLRIFPLLAIPALLPLVLLLYWMIRVLFTQWYRRRANDSSPVMIHRSA
jgi:uncharacterized membrane protein